MKKPLILLVDDDAEVTKSFSEAILDGGRYDVAVANSAQDALGIVNKNRTFFGFGSNNIKLVLLDIRMPEMTGIEFLDKLKQEVDARIDVIMVTAFDDVENWADSFFSHDIVTFLVKPVNRKDLIETIDAYFRGDKEEIRKGTLWDFRQKGIFEDIRKLKAEKQ